MSTYVVGDVHGCYTTLRKLLDKISFDVSADQLWLTGDLINRGDGSLQVLRFIRDLGDNAKLVLGNHEFHLFALAHNLVNKPYPQLQEIVDAPDGEELVRWLRHKSLVHFDEKFNCILVHAGVPHIWDLHELLQLNKTVAVYLQDDSRFINLLENMLIHKPNYWGDNLSPIDRVNCTIQYLTRMRVSDYEGILNLNYHNDLLNLPIDSKPWFWYPRKIDSKTKIIFGHWAAIMGLSFTANIYPLDTGCVWGKYLTALRLDDFTWFRQQYVG